MPATGVSAWHDPVGRLRCRLNSAEPGEWQIGIWPPGGCEEGASPPLALAGGLKPDNVRKAIRTVRPAAVDTASGVESAPGWKEPNAVRRFIAEARAAFDNFSPDD